MLTETQAHQQPLTPIYDLPELGLFDSAGFDEIVKIKRRHRSCLSYVFPLSELSSILKEASLHHRLLTDADNYLFDFKSQYYDTEFFDMYRDHHNDKLNRWKIRRCENLCTGAVSLEVKLFSNKDKTIKKVLETDNRNHAFSTPEKKFIKKLTPFKPKLLSPSLCNRYKRFTLLGRDNSLRVTFDLNMQFLFRGSSLELPNIVVAEIKQSQFSQRGIMHDILKNHNFQPKNFSKYCIGLALLNKQIKSNNFKTTINYINRIGHEYDISSTNG